MCRAARMSGFLSIFVQALLHKRSDPLEIPLSEAYGWRLRCAQSGHPCREKQPKGEGAVRIPK